jgi:hypothetical protein
VAGFKETSLLSIIKMAKADQLGRRREVRRRARTSAPTASRAPSARRSRRRWPQAKALLQACTDKLECYLAKLADPAVQDEKQQFTGIKAIYMVGILGSPDVRDKLLELMPKLKNSAIRGLAASVIDFHSPKGDKAVADKLQKIVDDVDVKKDPAMMATQSHFRYTIYRLNAKAQ